MENKKIPKCEICGTDWFDDFLNSKICKCILFGDGNLQHEDKKELEFQVNSIKEHGKCFNCFKEFCAEKKFLNN